MSAGCTRRNSEIGRIAESSVTNMLPAKTMGRTLKRGTTGAWKLTRPIKAHMPTPKINQRTAPVAPTAAATAAKNPFSNRSDAPSAFMIAKSRRRSNTHPISVDNTHSAAVRMISAAEASSVARVFHSTRASPSII